VAQDSSARKKADTSCCKPGIKIIEPADDIVFTKTEIEAAFPGGDMVWKRYTEKYLNNRIAAERGAPPGTYTVVVRFIVAADGKVSNIESETNNGYGMEKEAIKCIKNGPNWKPALQNGRPVRAYKRQSISFVVPAN
jgi:protein TonB